MSKYIIFIFLFLFWAKTRCQTNLQLISPEYNTFFTEVNNELWIASAGMGYNRYRGIDTKHYWLNDSISGLQGTYIQSRIFQDESGLLWTTTFEYLCYFDPRMDKFFCQKIVFKQDTIADSYHIISYNKIDKNLILRAKGQLLNYNTEKKKVVSTIGETIANYYEVWGDTIAGAPWMNGEGWEMWTKKNNVWNKKWYRLNDCELLSGRKVIKVLHTAGKVWLLTDDGLILFNMADPRKSILYKYDDFDKNIISDGLVSDSILWLSSRKAGVVIFNINKLLFQAKKRIERERVDNMFQDEYGRMWFSQTPMGAEVHDIHRLIPEYQHPELNGHWTSSSSAHGLDIMIDQENGLLIYNNGSKEFIRTKTKYLPLSTIHCAEILDTQRILVCDRFECITLDVHSKQIKKVALKGIRQLQNIKVNGDDLYVVADNNLSIFNTNNFKSINASRFDKYQGAFQLPCEFRENNMVFNISSSQILIYQDEKDTVINIGSFIQSVKFDVQKQQYFIGANDGLYTMDQYFKVTNVTRSNPLLSNQTVYDINMDDKWVYFSTKNRICRTRKESTKIEISDKLTFDFPPTFIVKDHTILVGSDISIEMTKDQWFDGQNSLSLRLDYLKVNDLKSDRFILANLNHMQNGLTWRYYINDTHHPEDNKIFFRLTPSIDTLWKSITNGDEIVFNNLSPGKYQLEIQGLKANGSYTAISLQPFTIHPPWYKTLWFGLLVGLGIFILMYKLYHYRIEKIKKQYLIQKEISDLERSALQAQMNPHFIFNCLNSIQNFIMKNDKMEAMEYLHRFAKLIRQNLNASTGNTLSLDEEISMLDNYLSLEQMRFNHRFDYEIKVSDLIEPTDIQIPPLLIQPFVENAIIHGVAETSYQGKISIQIDKNQDVLHVIIQDNGPGISDHAQHKHHKSLGMSITQKRLQHINDHTDDNYSIFSKSDEKGTEIKITVKI
ncbi:MAG: histidine kinase [Saprospiraceae bacterium]